MRVHANPRLIERHVGPKARLLPQAVDNRILQLQRPKMRVRDGRMLAREVARDRRTGRDVGSPIDTHGPRVELICRARLELGKLEEYAIRRARPQARAIRDFQ